MQESLFTFITWHTSLLPHAQAKSSQGQAAKRKGNVLRADGDRAVCGSLAVLRARELLKQAGV